MSLNVKNLGGPYQTVFDVGAFRGDFARECVRKWRRVRVHSFEPLEPRPADAQPAYQSGNWTWHDVALGFKPDRLRINRCEFVPSSSFLLMTDRHKDAFPYTREHTEQWVVVETLDDHAQAIEGKALLKIDVQGFELEVLRGGAVHALDLFHAVVLEVSWAELYAGAPTFDQIDRHLTRYGFEHRSRIDELRDPADDNVLLQTDELWSR